MRVGDFAVEIVAHGTGRVRETQSGHVLARPGQVYRLRLRNFGPLYCVAEVEIDGHGVTGGGLVLEPWGTTELERPVDAAEDGRFTVVAEGDETVFGPDGGRDDPKLGLVEARFRRELPRKDRRPEPPAIFAPRLAPEPPARPSPDGVPPGRLPFGPPPEWSPLLNQGPSAEDARSFTMNLSEAVVREESVRDGVGMPPGVERAAGTGLTGHSDQQFVPFQLGPLEKDATVVSLRIVIGSEAAIAEDAPRPLADRYAPARPAARP